MIMIVITCQGDSYYFSVHPGCKINFYLLNLFRRNEVIDGAGFYNIRIRLTGVLFLCDSSTESRPDEGPERVRYSLMCYHIL